MDLVVGQIATRTVFHYGVEYDCIRYNSALLGTLSNRTRENVLVQIRVYEHDISYVDVLMPDTDEYVRVHATDAEYCQGLNRHTHLLVRCRIPDDCIDSNRYPLFMARAVLQELIESLQSSQEVKPC